MEELYFMTYEERKELFLNNLKEKRIMNLNYWVNLLK